VVVDVGILLPANVAGAGPFNFYQLTRPSHCSSEVSRRPP